MLFGKWGAVVSSIVIVVSIAGYAQAGMMSNARMYVAMAQDGVLVPAFLKENHNTGVKPAVLIFILRKRQTGEETGSVFKVKPYPLVPVLFLTALGLVTLRIVFRNWRSVVYATAFFLLGWPIYVVLKRRNSSE